MTEAFHSIGNSETQQFNPERNSPETTFRIRAHHLIKYARLLEGMLPNEVAIGSLTMYRAVQPGDLNYSLVQDTVGSTAADFERHELGQQRFYKQFLALPSNSLVELVEDTPDNLCALCPIGVHCKQKFDNGKEKNGDNTYLDLFLNTVRQSSLASEVKVTKKTAEFLDAPARKVRVVQTTAGVFKSLLSEMRRNMIVPKKAA